MTKKSVTASVLHRVATIDAASIDTAARTVKVAFASELPYQRAFGWEILSVDAISIKTQYLDTGASVLVNHDWEDLVGVIVDYSIDEDKVARATVKFGRSDRANEVFQDVIDQVRRQISVGYMVEGMQQVDPIDGISAFRVVSWTPFEVSFVTVAADPSVGVGKSLSTRDFDIEVQPIEDFIKGMSKPADPEAEADDEEEKDMEEVADEKMAEDEKAVPVEAEEADDSEEDEEDDADADDLPGEVELKEKSAVIKVSENDPRVEAELARVSTLKQLGEKLHAIDIAKRCIEQGLDIESFKQMVVQSKSTKGNKMELGLNAQETKRFSIIRAMNAQISGDWTNAGFEREVSVATAQAMAKEGRSVGGIAIPFEVLTRTNNASSPTAGGNLVQSNVLGSSFIELLYNALVLPELGATFMEANSPFSLPKGSRTSTATFVSENGAAPAGAMAFTQVPFAPKRIADSTQLSKRLLSQSTVDVEALVMADFAERIALGIQNAAINGDGIGNNPLGILNQPAVQTLTFAGAAPSYAEIVSMESSIADQNIKGNAYLVSPVTKGQLKTTPLTTAGYPVFLMNGKEMNGYPVAVSKVIANGDVVYGNWKDLVIAHFSSLDIVVNPYTFATQNLIEVSVGMDCDVNVRRAESFIVGKH